MKNNSLLFGQTALYSPLHLTFGFSESSTNIQGFQKNIEQSSIAIYNHFMRLSTKGQVVMAL